jgi:hypothetical protein
MDRGHGCGSGHGILLSVVVDQLDIFGASVSPFETDPPLLVDADAVQAGAVSFQFLESIAWRDLQVAEQLGSVENQELPEGNPLGSVVELAGSLPLPDPLGLPISERSDHSSDSNGWRY